MTDKAPDGPPSPPSRPRRRTQAPIDPPIFPRSTPTYVGRGAELARAVGLATDETLHLVYGVGGVGKSELVFRIVEELRRQARWAEARAILVDLRPGMTLESLVANLAALAGARRARTELATGGAQSLDDDLAAAARALERSPALVFVDNLHHLDPAAAGHALGYLSRRVRGSRLFAASQVELILPPDAPPPIVYRLGPLDRNDTAALVERLAERLDTPPPDAGGVYERTGGSPFLVLRDLAGDRGGERSGLDQTLRELDAAARALLGALAVARRPITGEEAARVVGPDAVRELARRFLVDAGRDHVMIHDLIRDAVARTASRRDVAAAHRLLAELYGDRGGEGATGRGPDAADQVEIVHHLQRSGDSEDAWETCQKSYRAIAAAGLDHLLIDDLRALAGELPAARVGITLLSVRILVRRSLIAEAGDLLSTLGEVEAESARWQMLAGEIAHRRGRMQEAEAHFRRAHEVATEPSERLQAALAVADVATLRGANQGARAVLAEVAAQHAPLSPRDRARWGWSLALSYLIEERFAASVVAARAAADAIAGQGLDDLEGLLAMLELIGRCECDDVAAARALVDRTGAKSVHAGALRETVLAGYRGVVDYHAGDLPVAIAALDRSFAHLIVHADHTLASIAGYYLTRALLARGEISAAIESSTKIGRLATQAELATLGPHGRAALAEALLEADRIPEARAAAEAALAAPRRSDQTAWIASCLIARIAACEGDVGLARRQLAAAEAGRVEAPPSDLTPAIAPLFAAGADTPGDEMRDPATIDDSGPGAEAIFASAAAARSAALAIEGAWIELLGGDPAAAAARASAALAHYTATGRRGLEARAAVLRALALIARGGDRTEASTLIERAAEHATATGHVRVLALVGLARAALAARRGEAPAAVVGSMAPDLRHTEGRALAAAIAAVEPAPGLRALLSSLGLVSGLRYRVLGRGGIRVIGDTELERLRTGHRLVVEPARAAITATLAASDIRIDRGRPLACELLAALVEAQGAVVPAETLFLGVWGGREYHPLRHRNTLYVAIKRLRTTLRDLLGEDREIVETAAGGWRLADGVDAIVIRPLDDNRGDPGARPA